MPTAVLKRTKQLGKGELSGTNQGISANGLRVNESCSCDKSLEKVPWRARLPLRYRGRRREYRRLCPARRTWASARSRCIVPARSRTSRAAAWCHGRVYCRNCAAPTIIPGVRSSDCTFAALEQCKTANFLSRSHGCFEVGAQEPRYPSPAIPMAGTAPSASECRARQAAQGRRHAKHLVFGMISVNNSTAIVNRIENNDSESEWNVSMKLAPATVRRSYVQRYSESGSLQMARRYCL